MRYIKIFFDFLKYNTMADMEYRLNMILSFFADIIWYICQLSLFEAMFSYFPQMNGWTRDSIAIFMAYLFVCDSLWMLLFNENLQKLNSLIVNGELDLLLTKPINSQFMVSFRKISITYLANFLITLSWLVYSLQKMPSMNSTTLLLSLLWLILLVPLSLMISYALRFFFAAACLYFTHAESYTYLWYSFFKIATRPNDLYHKVLRYFSLFVIPLAFMYTIPAKIILGQEPWWMVIVTMALAVFLIYLSHWYWQRGLKKYSSASS